jgi:hypothetical protein
MNHRKQAINNTEIPMRKAATLGAIAALGMSSAAFADGVSHSYVEAGYGYGELAGGIVTGDGFKLGGSLELPKNFVVAATYRDFTFSDSGSHLDVSELSAGLGYKCMLGASFDLVTGASFERVKVESQSESGFGLSLATTGRISEKVELSAGLQYVDLGGDINSTYNLTVGVRRYFTPAFAIGLEVRKAEPLVIAGETAFIASARYDFGKLFK